MDSFTRHNILFREWTEKDQPKIEELYISISKEYFPDMMKYSEIFYEFIKDILNIRKTFYNNGGKFWVFEKNNEIIAMGGVRLLENSIAELKNFRVNKEYRGIGLGNMLLEESEKFCKMKNISKIILDTTERFTTAIKMYETHGYVIAEEKEMELLGVKYIQLNFHKFLDEK